MRQFVDSTQLDRWFVATRRQGQDLLPHLVRQLIFGTLPMHVLRSLRIPVGDDVTRPGYDGIVDTAMGNAFVPTELSVWEMGVSDPTTKAEHDYVARCQNPRGVDSSKTAFVFVTPHPWDAKETWATAKRNEGVWRDVRVIDSIDLAAWLETAPGAARWLARQIDVPVDGLRDIELFHAELQASVDRIVTPELLIGGRSNEVAILRKWIESDSEELTVEADSLEEAGFFISGALQSLPEQLRGQVLPRVLFAESPAALDYLSAAQVPHFIIPTTLEAKRRAKALHARALRLIIPSSRSAGDKPDGVSDKLLRIGKLRRGPVEVALVGLGLSPQRAGRIANECKGSLTALLWMFAERHDEPLSWTQGAATLDLVPLVLAGQWAVASESDQKAIERLAGRTYSDVERIAAEWSGPNGPLARRGPLWDWLAWDFAWAALAPAMTHAHFDRFRALILDVLGVPDPRFELPPDHRWAANLYHKGHPYSHALRSGLIGSIVQLALNGTNVSGGAGQAMADAIIRELLVGEKVTRKDAWPSLAPWLPDLAEASPSVFLEGVERLSGDQAAISVLFQEEGMLGSPPHVHLLWALERLAWSPDFLTRAVSALGDLAAVDPGGTMLNRPENTLVEIFLPWSPNTTANIEHRLAAIDVLFARHQKVAWQLCILLLPGRVTHSSPIAEPRWREWKTTDAQRLVSSAQDEARFTDEIVHRLLARVGTFGDRWAALIEAHERLRLERPIAAQRIIDALMRLDAAVLTEPDRLVLVNAVRDRISRHREFAAAGWAMSEKELKPFDEIYTRFQPLNLYDRYVWLFASWPHLPNVNRNNGNHEVSERQIDEERIKALKEILKESGVDGLITFANLVRYPDIVGYILAKIDFGRDLEADILDRTLAATPLQDAVSPTLSAGLAYIGNKFHALGVAWLDEIIACSAIHWDANRYANLGWALPPNAETWDRLTHWGHEAEGLYWLRTPIGYLANPDRDAERAINPTTLATLKSP